MNEIMKIINEWDPIGFFPLAPKDEYINEITKIYNLLISDIGIQPEQLAKEINDIFINTFGNDVYKENIIACRKIADKLLITSSVVILS